MFVLPLSNLKIIDLSRLLSGPYATMMFSDFGAEVIKVETPNGDDTRHLGPPFIEDWSTYFLSINRNKKSISLNLKTEEGKEILLKLIEEADVVIENFRPGTLERLGLSYEVMKGHNQGIILASISGFGQKGEYAQKPGYDVLAQAMGGLMSVTGEKGGTPVKAGYSFADLGTGMWAAFGILVALWERDRSGKGQWIDASLLDTIISWQTYLASSYFATGVNPEPLGTEHPNIVPYQVFEAADGNFVVAIANDKMWSAFTNKLNLDTLKSSKYDTNKGRVTHRDQLLQILKDTFMQRTRTEWDEFFTEIKVPVGPVNQLSEILQDPHVIERGMVQEKESSEIGKYKTLGIPLQLSRTPGSIRTFPPKLGEHTESILQDIGYRIEEISKFIDQEVVKTSQTKLSTK
nr:CoA transferase [Oceanobacillus arenosus]